MERWFCRESEIEYWLRPFTGRVTMPGYRHVLHTDTRLCFDLYWQLLELGYTEAQLADDVVFRRWGKGIPVPVEVAFTKTVYGLARHQGLMPSERFNCYLSRGGA